MAPRIQIHPAIDTPLELDCLAVDARRNTIQHPSGKFTHPVSRIFSSRRVRKRQHRSRGSTYAHRRHGSGRANCQQQQIIAVDSLRLRPVGPRAVPGIPDNLSRSAWAASPIQIQIISSRSATGKLRTRALFGMSGCPGIFDPCQCRRKPCRDIRNEYSAGHLSA